MATPNRHHGSFTAKTTGEQLYPVSISHGRKSRPWHFCPGKGCLPLSPTRKSICSLESRTSVFTLMDEQRLLSLPEAIFGCNCTTAVTFCDFFTLYLLARHADIDSVCFRHSSRLLSSSASHVSHISSPADGEIEHFQMVIWMTLGWVRMRMSQWPQTCPSRKTSGQKKTHHLII